MKRTDDVMVRTVAVQTETTVRFASKPTVALMQSPSVGAPAVQPPRATSPTDASRTSHVVAQAHPARVLVAKLGKMMVARRKNRQIRIDGDERFK